MHAQRATLSERARLVPRARDARHAARGHTWAAKAPVRAKSMPPSLWWAGSMGPSGPRGHPVGASISQGQNSFYGEERRPGQAGFALRCKVLPKREGTSHAFPSRAHSAWLFAPSFAFAARPPHAAEKWASAESNTRASTRVLLRVVSGQPQEDNCILQGTVLPPGIIPERTRARSTRVHRQREFRVMFASRIGGAADPSARRGSF